jgi:hypothetical protein
MDLLGKAELFGMLAAKFPRDFQADWVRRCSTWLALADGSTK